MIRNKKIRKITSISALILISIIAVLLLIEVILFTPICNKLSKVEVSKYNNGTYTKLTVSDEESLKNLYSMKKGITKKITILNSKIRESGKFQKDSQYIIDFNYENGDYQRIEITGNNTIIFNYCSTNEFPKFFLDNKSSSYDISLSRDGLTDYILQLYYENE